MDGLLSATAKPQKADLQASHHSQSGSSEPTATEAQAGSAIASLWLKVNHNSQPAAPSKSVHEQLCPQCGVALAPPLKSSGRQVCRCGWSDKPRSNQVVRANAGADLSAEADLLRLLEQAASESIENMKSRKPHS